MSKQYSETPVSVRLTNEQLEFCKANGGRSKVIRKLLDKEIKLYLLLASLVKSGQKENASSEAYN